VAVIGGGNSAGQAVVRFSRYAAHVTLLVRGSSLEASMSQYLITQVGKLPNVEVRTNTEVVELEADQHLRALIVSSTRDAIPELSTYSTSRRFTTRRGVFFSDSRSVLRKLGEVPMSMSPVTSTIVDPDRSRIAVFIISSLALA